MSPEATVFKPDIRKGKEGIGMGVPRHVLLIPDNNRTWARQHGVTVAQGYDLGARRIVEAAQTATSIGGLDYLTVHLVSGANLRERLPEELGAIWTAVQSQMLDTGLPELIAKNNARIRVVGDMTNVPEEIKEGFSHLCEASKDNTGLAFTVLIGYDQKKELADAINATKAAGEEINADTLSSHFYLPHEGLPDVNAVIRTGEEERTSGVLPSSIANAELLFVRDCFWPDFDEERFRSAVIDVSQRKQKGGK